MQTPKWFLVIALLYVTGFFAHALYLKKTVYGDGVYYYEWLRSAVVDHKLPPKPNKYNVGPAIVWSIPFIWTHSIIRGKGVEFPYQLAVGLTSVLLTIFGLVLLYRLLKGKAALITIIAIALATNLFFYGSLDTVNSHALSFFASILFITFIYGRQSFAAGIALGLLGAIRTQDLIFGLIAIPLLNYRLLIGFIIAFAPQMAAWQLLNGNFLNNPYLASGESFNFLRPHILEVLFSLQNGLFTYSPILILGVVGLFFWKNRFNRFFHLAILLELLIVSSWSTWWQGASYGGRMLVSSLPLFAFGIAEVFQFFLNKLRSMNFILSAIIIPLSLLNFLLIFLFLLKT